MTTRDLFDAISRKDVAKVAVLVDPARSPLVDVNGRDVNNLTPLLAACHFVCQPAIVALLLKVPAVDVNAKSGYGNTPLILACKDHSSNMVIAEMLLADPRLDTGVANADGETPLWRSVRWGNVGIIKRLIACARPLQEERCAVPVPGVSPEACTALDLARLSKDVKITQLLEDLAREPAITRHSLQVELNYPQALGCHLFALVVLLCDEHLSITKGGDFHCSIRRYFRVTRRLPMELQMIACRRPFGECGDLINSKHLEPALKHTIRLLQ